jgi:hypothetical protein
MICKLCGNQYNAPKCSFCGLAPNENPVVTALYFGKHKGETIEQVFYREPGYLQWMLRENVGTPAQRAQARLLLSRQSKTESNSSFSFGTILVAFILIAGIGWLVVSSNNASQNTAPAPIPVTLPTPTSGFVINSAPTATARPTPTTRPAPTATPSPQELSAKGELLYPAPNCVIKGNVEFNEPHEKIYHVPGGRYYDATKIDTRYGERWFCTETDAINNGWRKSKE